jgi:hypothetical protein
MINDKMTFHLIRIYFRLNTFVNIQLILGDEVYLWISRHLEFIQQKNATINILYHENFLNIRGCISYII